jgi:hypothetical protein
LLQNGLFFYKINKNVNFLGSIIKINFNFEFFSPTQVNKYKLWSILQFITQTGTIHRVEGLKFATQNSPLLNQYLFQARGPCIFPFRYQGKVFNECSTEFSRNNRPWCATKVDSNQNTVGNNRGYCNCVGSQSSTTLAPAATRWVKLN